MREHRCFTLQFRLNENLGYNRELSSASRRPSVAPSTSQPRRARSPRRPTTSSASSRPRPGSIVPTRRCSWPRGPPRRWRPASPWPRTGARPPVHRLRVAPRQRRHVHITRRTPTRHSTSSPTTSPPARPEIGTASSEDPRAVRGVDRSPRASITRRSRHGPRGVDDAVIEPASSTGTAATTPSAPARWAPPTPTSSTRSSASGGRPPAGHGLFRAAGHGGREPQRPDHGDGVACRRHDPRRPVTFAADCRMTRVLRTEVRR